VDDDVTAFRVLVHLHRAPRFIPAWHTLSSAQSAHLGLRAMHNLRPCQISDAKQNPLFPWNAPHQILLQFSADHPASSVLAVARCGAHACRPPRLRHLEPRPQHHVRGLPCDARKRKKFPHLFRNLPAELRDNLFAAPTTDLDLLRKNPVDRTSGSSCSGVSAAKAATVGYLRNNSGVTRFTFTSVDCADSIVATTSSHALACVSAHVTSDRAVEPLQNFRHPFRRTGL